MEILVILERPQRQVMTSKLCFWCFSEKEVDILSMKTIACFPKLPPQICYNSPKRWGALTLCFMEGCASHLSSQMSCI